MESTSKLPFGVRINWSLMMVASSSDTSIRTLFISIFVKIETGKPSVVRNMRAMRSMRSGPRH